MIVMALIGLDLALVRAWLVPRNYLREFGPMTTLSVVAVMVGFVAKGRLRQIGFGLAASWLVISVAFRLAPWPVREAARLVVDSIADLIPLPASTISPQSWEFGVAVTYDLEELTGNRKDDQFHGVRAQSVLGLFELPIALYISLIVSARWSRHWPATESPRLDRP